MIKILFGFLLFAIDQYVFWFYPIGTPTFTNWWAVILIAHAVLLFFACALIREGTLARKVKA